MKKFAGMLFVCFAAALCGPHAAEYPARPVEMVIPFEAGSSTDVMGRFLAGLVEKDLGVKLVINNKPGGSGATGYAYVKNSRPDGYVLGMVNSTIASHKVFGNLPFDYNDVDVILLFQTSPSVLCVPADSKYQTFPEVIADARARPGEITYATTSGNVLNGTRDFSHHAGVRFKIIPFGAGGQQPVIQTSGGHVDMCFVNIVDAKAQIDAGLLRPLATYGKTRIPFLPDVPTFEEFGYPVRCPVVRGLIAPPGMDRERLEIINNAFRKAVQDQRFIDFVHSSAGTPLNASFEEAVKILDEQKKAFEAVAEQEKQKDTMKKAG